MGISNERLKELAQVLAAFQQDRKAPQLRVVGEIAERPLSSDDNHPCPGDRRVLSCRIRDLVSLYDLGWLMRQETSHVGFRLELLSLSELSDILDRLQRAMNCPVDDVSYMDAGLIRSEKRN